MSQGKCRGGGRRRGVGDHRGIAALSRGDVRSPGTSLHRWLRRHQCHGYYTTFVRTVRMTGRRKGGSSSNKSFTLNLTIKHKFFNPYIGDFSYENHLYSNMLSVAHFMKDISFFLIGTELFGCSVNITQDF